MTIQRDDWEKPRSKGQHLTEDEIAFIKREFRKGRTSRDVARELKCSSRVVSKYFGFFVAEGVRRTIDKPLVSVTANSRFYKSSFEL